jgi:hypothetical protein
MLATLNYRIGMRRTRNFANFFDLIGAVSQWISIAAIVREPQFDTSTKEERDQLKDCLQNNFDSFINNFKIRKFPYIDMMIVANLTLNDIPAMHPKTAGQF